MTTGRNEPCPCGSGKKYKQCCLLKERPAAKPAFDIQAALQQGFQLHQAGQFSQAEMIYRRILEAKPNHPDALHLLGLLAQKAGNLDAACDLLRKAIKAKPDEARLYGNLANILNQQGKSDAALEQAGKALKLQPDLFDVRYNLANMLKAQGRLEDAIREYQRVLALKPTHDGALNNLGISLNEAGRAEKALACFESLAEVKPDFAEGLNNQGSILMKLGRFAEAGECFRRALAIKPDYLEALDNLGYAVKSELGLATEAEVYQAILAKDPNLAEAHWSFATTLLSAGELRAGWEEFDWRFATVKGAGSGRTPRNFPQPLWRGEPLGGKTLLVWGEQGVGDEMMYAGVLPDAVKAAGRVIVECEPRLVSLFVRSFPGVEVVGRTFPPQAALLAPRIDYQTPAGSLPRWYRPTLESFPDHAGYLKPDPERVAYWKQWLGNLGDGPKVGIAWRSMHGSARRDRHYTELEQWGDILKVPGVAWINLQYDDCREELAAARQRFGVEIHEPPGIDLKDDLDEVAALTKALDLIVSAGTSVIGMAGAVGAPAWMFTLEGNWTLLGTDHLPWMPSVKLYGKGVDEDWEPLLQGIAADLEQWTRSRNA